MSDATVTPIRRRERTTRNPDPRITELQAMLTDPAYAGWTTELQAELDKLTNTDQLAA